MKVSGFWSLAGLVVGGWILADLIIHPAGTATAFKGVTGLTGTAGNLVTGRAA